MRRCRCLRHIASRFARDDRGATAIEYGLIAALIAIGALGGMVGARRRHRRQLGQHRYRVSEATKR